MVTWKRVSALAVSFIGGGIAGMNLNHRLKNWLNIDSIKAASPTDVNRPNEIMKFGFPKNSSVNVRQNYVLSYDNRLKNASWVFEHLNKDLLNDHKESDRRNSNFVEDPAIHAVFRATNHDYFKSGYDRGHLAAASNSRASQEWMNETFYLSNIVPQDPFMNRNAWNNLEKYVRSLAYHYDNVYVCTGPLYLPQTDEMGRNFVTYQVIGSNHVAVPTHLFKVVVCERRSQFELLSYVMENKWVDPERPLNQFLAPVELIEKASGLIFFDRIPKDWFRRINQLPKSKTW